MDNDKKILVAYYSYSGNTRRIAEFIKDAAGGDVFEIIPKAEYPANYNECVEQAKREIKNGYEPAIEGSVNDFGSYDVVFIGSPNWWSTVAPPVSTFLSMYDFAGKTVIPFCTHGGGSCMRLFSDITKKTGETKLPGLEIYGGRAESSKEAVLKWLKKLNISY